MPNFCTQCGKQLREDDRYCSLCGRKIDCTPMQAVHPAPPATGDNCIHCGHPIPSFAVLCPYCGLELPGKKASAAIKELSRKIEEADKEGAGLLGFLSSVQKNHRKTIAERKADLITTFAVPGSKQDVLEFLLLATFNVDPDLLSRHSAEGTAYSEEDFENRKLVSKAWYTKAQQVFHKAELMLKNDADFMSLREIYLSKTDALTKKHHKTEKTRLLIPIVACCCLAACFLIPWCSYRARVAQLESTVQAIYQDIEEGNYDIALLKANSLYMDIDWSSESKDRWNHERESIIEKIQELQQQAKEKP